ncbi:MAG: pyridoxal-phosphate dependent enzyme [Candidatus Paceibacterota bacterium]
MKNFYQGDDAIRNYLNPHNKEYFPLVELDNDLNPYKDEGIHIYVKVMCTNPFMNIKMLPAWSMLENADLQGKKYAVEYSSGNTVTSMSVLASYFGLEGVKAIITGDVPEHKQKALRLVGADLIISQGDPTPKVNPPTGGIKEAIDMGKEDGYINLHQYINEFAPKASEEFIGKELVDVLGEDINTYCASIGTSGTLYGSAKYLKEKNKDTFVLASAIETGESIPGPRGRAALPFLGFDWQSVVDDVSYVRAKEAYEYSLKLIRKGLFLGPSSGMQYFSVLEYIKKMIDSGHKDKLKEKGGNFIFLGCDTMHPYIDEYFKVLDIE